MSVVDDGGAPVAGATVAVVYTGTNSGNLSGVTGSDGTVTFVTVKSWAMVDFCFEVTDMTHTTLAYEPAANQVTKACEGGDVFGAGSDPLVAGTALFPNQPNPFNPMTEISFSLAGAGPVDLGIYNVKGELVATLAAGTYGAGYHAFTWDARSYASGVYFYRLRTADGTETRKMIMLK